MMSYKLLSINSSLGEEKKYFKQILDLYCNELLFLIIAKGLSRAISEAKRVEALTGVNMGVGEGSIVIASFVC